MFKKVLFVSIAMVMTGVMSVCGAQKESGVPNNGVSAYGRLKVSGTTLTDINETPVILRGVSSHGISWYPRYLNGNAFKTLREEGANLMRIAMYTEPKGAYIDDPQRSLDYLYMGIESALAQDMYVIVDWHVMREKDPNIYVDEAVEFFKEITAHYGDEPGILYEICNEPNGDVNWDQVAEYANRVIPVIRSNSPNAVVLVGVPDYCRDFSGVLERPLKFENIMYSMHYYIDVSEEEPFHVKEAEKWPDRELPIFVTEWGVTQDEQEEIWKEEGDKPENWNVQEYPKSVQPFLDLLNERNLSWAAWSLSNKNESHSILKYNCEKLGGWTREDLTGFGQLVFDNFRTEKGEN